MGEGFQLLDIVLFAMVAAFLVLRLRSVLGKRTGHEQPRQDSISQRNRETESDGNALEPPDRNRAAEAEPIANVDPDNPLAAGITEIQASNGTFDPEEFAQGARSAFEMIVQGFAAGDKDNLKMLLADDVYENFEAAINEREEAEETLESAIIGIKNANVIEAGMEGQNAMVTVKFLSEQVNVTRDSEDRVIDGDPNQVTEITDIWTFSRDTNSDDPNWTVVETGSEN
ncbi:MAG: Tim44/TimA family putative adaptor protein [Pseudomonadota bacterium]|nr:Tim44/TimA family putative adaptor protein [Pseudomonadota bacterium]